jgi:hypothetical protein
MGQNGPQMEQYEQFRKLQPIYQERLAMLQVMLRMGQLILQVRQRMQQDRHAMLQAKARMQQGWQSMLPEILG